MVSGTPRCLTLDKINLLHQRPVTLRKFAISGDAQNATDVRSSRPDRTDVLLTFRIMELPSRMLTGVSTFRLN